MLTDVDECSYEHPCSQDCMNILGSFKCECYEGYELAKNSTTECIGMLMFYFNLRYLYILPS